MRPNVQLTRDPLNLAAMPPTEGLELDYRTTSGPPGAEAPLACYQLLLWSAIGMVTILVLRAAGVVQVLSSPIVFALTVFLSAFIAFTLYLRKRPAYVWLSWALAGPVLWTLIVVTRGTARFVLCLPAIALAAYLAHRVVTHYARWMHANPHLSRETRVTWLRLWAPVISAPQTPSTVDTTLELNERDRYRAGFAIIAFAYLLAIAFHRPDRPLSGLLAVFVFVAVVVFYGLYNCADYCRGRVSPPTFLRLVWRALLSFLTYNAREIRAPGVFQSPWAPSLIRTWLAASTIFCLSLSFLPAVSYCPVALALTPEEPWLKTALSRWTWPWDEPKSSLRIPPPPTLKEVERSLTKAERVYLEQLGSDSSRKPFLDLVARRRHAEAISDALRPARTALTAKPESWLLTALRGTFTGKPMFVWSLLLAVVGSILLSPIVFLSLSFAVGGRVLTHFYLTLEAPGACYHRPEALSDWGCYQLRLRESQHETTDDAGRPVRERDHLFVGVSVENDYPVLLYRDILTEHAHFTGDTGSGKSSLGIAPIVAQLIGRPGSSVVVLDLKGDTSLFEAARIGAAKDGLPFYWFTNRPHSATYVFNPFLQAHMGEITKTQLAEVLLKSLGLEYGEGYGPAFFSSVHRDLLTTLLNQYDDINSFRRLRYYLTEAPQHAGITREQRDRATHLVTLINTLATFDALNVTAADALPEPVLSSRIDMSRVITTPCVVYFYLHSALQEATVREIAKLALHSLLAAATLNKRRDHQVYLFIDEFQQIVSADLEIVLRMARDAKIATVLANQTMSDLKTNAVDLRPTVQANTRYKQVFSSTDLLQQDDLIKASGETIYEMISQSHRVDASGSSLRGISIQETIGPRLRRNDIIETSDAEKLSIVQVSRGRGYTQFAGHLFRMRSEFHIPYEEYRRRSAEDWPQASDYPGTYVPPIGPPPDPKKQLAPVGAATAKVGTTRNPPPQKSGGTPLTEMLDRL